MRAPPRRAPSRTRPRGRRRAAAATEPRPRSCRSRGRAGASGPSPQILRQQLHQELVLPLALVHARLPQDAHAPEADLLVSADGGLVLDRGRQRRAVMTALLEAEAQ